MTDPGSSGPDLATLRELRKPLPAHLIGKLPGGIPEARKNDKSRCDVCHGYHGPAAFHLDYAGHAAITDRLLDVDPLWSWEPAGYDDRGLPIYETDPGGQPIGMWIRLTVCGVTRLGFGDAVGKKWGPTAIKEVIGDAIRNGAMRFGVGLDLWHKGDLDAATGETEETVYEGPLTGQECADAAYAADTEREIVALTRRFPGGKAEAEAEQVADPGTGEVVSLLAFVQQCRAVLAETGEPLRVRRVRADAKTGQDEPSDPAAIGHVETAAERAERIAVALAPKEDGSDG